MPCRTDYMEPNARERESVVVGMHLKYLMTLLGAGVPGDVAKAADHTYGVPELVDQHTALLCDLMKTHGNKIAQRLEKGQVKDAELWFWWVRHQESDRKREAAERATLLRERAKDMEEIHRLADKYPDLIHLKE